VSTSQQVLTGESFIVREANQEPIAEDQSSLHSYEESAQEDVEILIQPPAPLNIEQQMKGMKIHKLEVSHYL